MHWIDWLIMVLPLAICACIAIYSRRFVRSVADFMAGGRSAGRYLVCAARSEQGSGAAVFVASFQSFIVAGFTPGWWGQLSVPIAMLVMVTGWVVYRYRQTRAMTLGQFFEMRYSRNFRLFAGFLGFFAGLVNFGIIPVLGAHFMVAFLRWPLSVELPIVHFVIPTYLLLMALFLTICVIMTTTAGQVSVLLTDCAEGMISQIFYTIIGIVLLITVFHWLDTKAILLNTKPGESLVNPFDSLSLDDFNIWVSLAGIIGSTLYRTIAWQNSHAFNSSASNAHEARMGGILGRWRGFAVGVMVTLLSVCALTYMRMHQGAIEAELAQLPDEATRNQMRSPLALTMMLPTGIKGMLLSIALMGIIAGDGIHLHSWGSILIQDVLVPLRKKPLTPEQHIKWLRIAIVGVALWAFLFGWLMPQIDFVGYWWGITEAIFVSGAGIVIIGGLYSKRGTTPAAWTAMIVGSVLAMTAIGIEFYYSRYLHQKLYMTIPGFDYKIHLALPILAFFVMLFAVGSYVVVSMMTYKKPHDMDKLLNRGQYSVEPESNLEAEALKKTGTKDTTRLVKKPNWFYRIITFGIDEQFSRADRFITISITLWSMFWFTLFVVGSIVCMFYTIPNEYWADYWLWTAIYMPLGIGAITTIWFTWGCTHDMVKFFKALKAENVDLADDGTVSKSEGSESAEEAICVTFDADQPAPKKL